MAVLTSETHIGARTITTPGDIRSLGRGVRITLARDATTRDDWSALLSAFAIAIGRGASVEWCE